MKLFYCLLLLLCPYVGRNQVANTSAAKPMETGQKVPDIFFHTMYNAKEKTLHLYDVKATLILLDFWSTTCAGCIKKIPLLDSLQEAMPSTLKVLLVNSVGTRDDVKRIERLFNRIKNEKGERYQLTSAVLDSQAIQLFPHKTIPHYVWIDSSYRLLAITESEEITTENIMAYLTGEKKKLFQKTEMLSYDRKLPLFINSNGGNGAELLQRSTLAGYIPGLPSSTFVQTNTEGLVTAIKATNNNIFSLLMLAWDYRPYANQVVFNTGRIELVQENYETKWLRDNGVSYELLTPPISKDKALALMRADLGRYFELSARIKMEMRDVWLLQADSNLLKKFINNKGKPEHELENAGNRYMKRRTLATLVSFLDEKLDKPVIDETRFKETIDLALPVKKITALAVNEALCVMGIRLVPGRRMVKTFTVSDYVTKQIVL